jgi:hypothetical protein
VKRNPVFWLASMNTCSHRREAKCAETFFKVNYQLDLYSCSNRSMRYHRGYIRNGHPVLLHHLQFLCIVVPVVHHDGRAPLRGVYCI